VSGVSGMTGMTAGEDYVMYPVSESGPGFASTVHDHGHCWPVGKTSFTLHMSATVFVANSNPSSYPPSPEKALETLDMDHHLRQTHSNQCICPSRVRQFWDSCRISYDSDRDSHGAITDSVTGTRSSRAGTSRSLELNAHVVRRKHHYFGESVGYNPPLHPLAVGVDIYSCTVSWHWHRNATQR
jgi:hypothetical protein